MNFCDRTPSEKISITPSDMKKGAEDMMHKASEDATGTFSFSYSID